MLAVVTVGGVGPVGGHGPAGGGIYAHLMTPPNTRLRIDISPEAEVGVYANFVSIWHDADTFTLDFVAVTRQPTPTEDSATGQAILDVPARVVSRVRVPPSQVFEIMKALEQQLTAFERERAKPASG